MSSVLRFIEGLTAATDALRKARVPRRSDFLPATVGHIRGRVKVSVWCETADTDVALLVKVHGEDATSARVVLNPSDAVDLAAELLRYAALAVPKRVNGNIRLDGADAGPDEEVSDD